MSTKVKNRKLRFSTKHGKPKKMLSKKTINLIRGYHDMEMSIRWIARQLHVSRQSVRKYINPEETGERKPREKEGILAPFVEIVEELFYKYNGNCAKVRQTLINKFGITCNERTVRRFCECWRPDLKAKHAHIRFEMKPGQQMQIDFGEMDVIIAGQKVRVHFMVSYLKYSRRVFVKAYLSENQAAWKDATECSFVHFGGVPVSLLTDNSKCLVKYHKPGEAAVLTEGWESFCNYWGVYSLAATPGCPRTKGGVERMVRYTKENGLVGESFNSLDELNEYLERWCLTIADQRVLSHVFEGSKVPKERFEDEKKALRPLKARTYPMREENRKVGNDGLMRVDNELYRVPDSLRNRTVQILVDNKTIQVNHSGIPVIALEKHKSVYQPKQQECKVPKPVVASYQHEYHINPLQRPLLEYQINIGSWNDKYRFC